MKAYISVSFDKRKSLSKEITAIIETLNGFGILPFVFVDNYTFDPTQEQQMMRQAMTDIESCDIIIAETSDKAIGIGVEVGYAKAKGKTVIYLRQQDTAHSTTVSGISDYQIIYTNTVDLKKQLGVAISKLTNQLPSCKK